MKWNEGLDMEKVVLSARDHGVRVGKMCARDEIVDRLEAEARKPAKYRRTLKEMADAIRRMYL